MEFELDADSNKISEIYKAFEKDVKYLQGKMSKEDSETLCNEIVELCFSFKKSIYDAILKKDGTIDNSFMCNFVDALWVLYQKQKEDYAILVDKIKTLSDAIVQ